MASLATLDTARYSLSTRRFWRRFIIGDPTPSAPSAVRAVMWSPILHLRGLAIVDLSDAGQQPMSDEAGRYTMVFNGEIYNSPALRRECERAGHRFRSSMDGEVILHLWETQGPSALERLNGIFAVAVFDSATGELFLARDPLGVKPLMCAEADGELWFASELHALLAMGAPTGGADLVALAQFLSFLWIPDPRTPYAGVRSIEPGTVVRWTPNGSSTSRYSQPFQPAEAPEPIRAEHAVEELRSRFADAVHRQLLSDVPSRSWRPVGWTAA